MQIWVHRASPQQGEVWYPEATPTGPHVINHTGHSFPPAERNTQVGCICIGVGLGLGSG